MHNCFISELTIAEFIYGIAKSAPTRQAANRQNLTKIQQLFASRILPIAAYSSAVPPWPTASPWSPATPATYLAGIQLQNWIDAPPAGNVAQPL